MFKKMINDWKGFDFAEKFGLAGMFFMLVIIVFGTYSDHINKVDASTVTTKTAQLSPKEMKSLRITPADMFLALAKANEDKGNTIHLIKPLNESLPQLIHEVMTKMEFAAEKGYTYIPMEMEDSPDGQELFNALKDKLEGSGYIVESNYMNGGRHIANGTQYFGYVVILKK